MNDLSLKEIALIAKEHAKIKKVPARNNDDEEISEELKVINNNCNNVANKAQSSLSADLEQADHLLLKLEILHN